MHKDLAALQGTWTVKTLEMDGQSMGDAMLGDARIVVDGKRFTSNGMGSVYEGTLVVDATAKPAHIDMKFDAGPEKGNTNLGIYQLDGDSWKLCLDTRGGKRPTKFASPAGSGIAVETLVREGAKVADKAKGGSAKKAAPTPTATGPATEFEGEWPLVSAVMDGKPMEASMVSWVKRVTQGNQTTVLAGPQTMLKVEFTYDPSTSPPSIDYVSLAGANKGMGQKGIYKFEADVLSFCVAAPGEERPKEFESVKGDKRTLTVWKRA